MTAFDPTTLEHRPTPLLRWGPALLKLELLRPPRAAEVRDFAASGHHALSRARHGARVSLLGAVTHEMRETLKLWGATHVEAAEPWLPAPDSLVRELEEDLPEGPALAVAAAADLQLLVAIRARWPRVRAVALLAADEALPDLPLELQMPDFIETVRVSRADAARARQQVATSLGLLAGHASSAAAVFAHEHGGLAIVSAPGEREFSLERAP